jgi:hypothetical protein
MKLKKRSFIILLLSFGMMSSVFFSSCKKDKSMEAIIVVKLMSDTMQRVPDARVVLSQGDVEVIGYTNQNGEYRHTFDLPIMLDITVTKDTMKGLGTIGLGDPGHDVTKFIYLH